MKIRDARFFLNSARANYYIEMNTFIAEFIARFTTGDEFTELKYVNRTFCECIDIGCEGRCRIIYRTARAGANDECMKLITEARASHDVILEEYRAAVIGAALGGHIELCKILAESCDNCKYHIETMLTFGAVGGYIDICRFARDRGANNIDDVVMRSSHHNVPESMEFAMSCYAKRAHENGLHGMIDDDAIFDIGKALEYNGISDEIACIIYKYSGLIFI